jgi:uncharacterized membrane protein
MLVDVSTNILIKRPVSDVYSFASEPDNAPKWYKNIASVEWVTDRPLQLGSRVAFVAHFLGRTLKYTYEVDILEPGATMVMKTSEGPFPMETSYTWRAGDSDTTEMELRNRGEPRGFSRWVAPLMSGAMRRANIKDLQLLKALLEAR